MLAHTPLLLQLDTLSADPRTGFVRLRHPVDVTSLPGWLKGQTLYPQIYWHARERDREFACLGSLQEIRDPAALAGLSGQAKPEGGSWPRYYGGLAFDPEHAHWPEFGPCRFVLPRIELIRQGNHTELVCNLWLTDDNREAEMAAARDALNALQPALATAPLPPQPLTRQDSPDLPRWRQMVAAVLAPDSLSRIPKVVLSRQSRLALAQAYDPWDLIAAWQPLSLNCFHFVFRFSPQQSFLACSPERLYRRQGRELATEALAGTIVRCGDAQRDAELAAQLLADNKNRLENRLVHADILTRLEGLADEAHLFEPQIFSLRRVQHLKRDIQARLLPGVTDAQLLAALHPTPAVGGCPRRKSKALIHALEPQERGWYAGACGLISEDVAEFAVAIRCGRLQPDSLTLFAGAGIVEGSEPDAEWQELDDKLATLLGALPHE